MRNHNLSRKRVLAAFDFRPPDRIPRFDNFWDYPDEWERRLGPASELNDIRIWVPDEGTFPTRARILEERGDWTTRVDTWGRTIRDKRNTYFSETLKVPIPPGVDPDSVQFDSSDLDERYRKAGTTEQTLVGLQRDKERFCVFGKTGGPYLRTTFVRGEEQFLMDIAGDPPLARALTDKMADHLIDIAREQIQRWSLCDTGVWIYDDMAYNNGPMFSPRSFEYVFLPAYRRMVEAYKAAGAKYVLLHSDGNIMPILDMLVDAGIDGLNPLEKRAGMDAVAIRHRYPDLILTGGMCNTDTLVHGPPDRIERETKELIDLGRDGGIVIGAHSISPEIPLEHFVTYDHTCRTYGDFASRPGQMSIPGKHIQGDRT
jgi:uroporphyrinogen decarboxylase